MVSYKLLILGFFRQMYVPYTKPMQFIELLPLSLHCEKQMLMLYKYFCYKRGVNTVWNLEKHLSKISVLFLKVANSLKLCWYLQIHWIIQGFPTKMLKTWLFWRGWKFDFIGNFPFLVKMSTCQSIFLFYKPQLQKTIIVIFHRTSPSSFC